MTKFYFIQLVGVVLTVLGMIALTATSATSYLYGKPLSRDERLRMGEKRTNIRRMPINLETIITVVFFLGGMGILSWSKFSLCIFLTYWLPNLPDALIFLLSCR